MAKLSILAVALFLQGVFQCCLQAEPTYTLKSFKRWDKADSFLKIEWDEHKNAFNLSFTGFQTDPRTKFIHKTEGREFSKIRTFRPAERPEYILAVEEGSLVLKNISDVTVDQDISKYNFLTRRVELRYSDANDLKEEDYHIIESQATPKRVIKSNGSGKVSLSVNWKNCGAWVQIL